ncbi:MAG: LamG domain-containing protein [Gammaproteobacteria bacterium]|nr:LamG domain-containing protein [Gammaproteobacteria bacterium]
MTKAIRIATQALAQRSVRAATVALLSSIFLAACGGGAQTTDNPLSQGPGNNNDTVYTGPVARDADVLKFQQEFWTKTKTTDRCGSCHNESVGQVPMFVRNDDVNMAYDEAVTVTNIEQPSLSRIVEKVSEAPIGHNCWVADPGVCGTIMTTWIENWVGSAAGGGREIILTAPADRDPSDSKNFPTDPALFEQIVHTPILAEYCAGCHSSESPTAQQPFFAEPDVASAYEAAKSKINLDSPADSRFVIKVSPGSQGGEAHNCWNNDCATASVEMLNAITTFANAIDPTTVNPDLVYSKAVRLVDGTLASGGNRYENDQIALWEFKTGTGLTAFDSSGVDPAIDLNFSGDVTWYGGWGITIGYNPSQGPGKAQGSTTASRKLADILQESGEFSIEAWVVPANVTQEMSKIVSYSAGQTSRNFTLQQTLYNYDFLLRTNAEDANGDPLTDLNGNPQLSTPDADEVLQATLQHVVATYNPIDGRRIYVNGELVSNADPVPGGTFVDWQDTFALVLGNEASGDGLWEGTIRLAAIHRRALAEDQIAQNFDAGVGERFYLLFDISERISAPPQTSYVLFEAQQFDSYSYLFDKPHFTTLDDSTPTGISMQGMRIAMNGQEAPVGQSYANMDETLDLVGATMDELGQPLSVLGAVLPLEKGPQDDEFFLTFDNLDGVVFDRSEDPMLVVTDYIATAEERKSDIGVRTFDEIDATYAAITGIDRVTYQRGGNFLVDETYQELRQSLPAVENIEAVLSSHQVAIAQLAIQYCDAAVEDATMWPGFNFGAAPGQAFSVGNRDSFVEPLIARAVGHSSTGPQLDSQPSYAIVHDEIAAFISGGGNRPDNLIDRLLAGGTSDTPAIAKGVCASLLGSAATLVQ